MTSRITILLAALALPASGALAGDLHRDAAIGGAVGGAIGGVVGAEVGGREGAVIGSGIGAAVGTGIATEGTADKGVSRERHQHVEPVERDHHPRGRFCPPGLAKQGRC